MIISHLSLPLIDNDDRAEFPPLKTPACPDIQPMLIKAQGIFYLLSDLDSY